MSKQTELTSDAFERALGEIRTRVCASAQQQRIAIAYSGGLDSSVLLHLAHRYAVSHQHRIALYAFHIHHGISPYADDWLEHCERECAKLHVTFEARRITLTDSTGKKPNKGNIEETARMSRYAALGDLCRTYQAPLLLTAHHQDDQAETVLLQLLRGSGTAGLSGMGAVNTAPDLLGDEALLVGRPLLMASRAELVAVAAENGIAYVDDESNNDVRYARNALRHHVMPAIAQYFPGFQERFARSARHAQAAQRLLDDIAAQDLMHCYCPDGEYLDLKQLRLLNTDRIDNLLRHWLTSRGVRMPSTAWLAEMRTQLLYAKPDARLCVEHPDCQIRRHRDRLFLRLGNSVHSLPPSFSSDAQSVHFRWRGEAEISFPAFNGTLFFDKADRGLDAEWLKEQDLSMGCRAGGERLKLAHNRPARSLKQHYQALGIPFWEREHLPLVMVGNDLLYAAGIGMDYRQFGENNNSPAICLRWQGNVE